MVKHIQTIRRYLIRVNKKDTRNIFMDIVLMSLLLTLNRCLTHCDGKERPLKEAFELTRYVED